MNHPQIIDANLNRASEGLRVIEDFCRFVSQNKAQTDALSSLRKRLNLSETSPEKNLAVRNTEGDMRAKETPTKRSSDKDLLKANFKRAEEACRVLEEYTGNSLYNEIRYDLYQLEKTVLLPLFKKEFKRGIYLISDDPDTLKKGLDWGVSLIQLRDKNGSKETRLNKAAHLQPLAKKAGCPLIINDDLDIALLVDSDGFHSGQNDLPVSEQRKLLGDHKIIGKTTHNLEQGLHAQADGADYVSVGPLWETPSKPGRIPIGLDYLKQAKAQLHIPYVAIGGIEPSRFEEVLAHQPPLIGFIRASESIPHLKKLLNALEYYC
jgi:thiamine-phosphate pyrophosphorylase